MYSFLDRREIVEHLIDVGADINAINLYGKTPLHISVENGIFIEFFAKWIL